MKNLLLKICGVLFCLSLVSCGVNADDVSKQSLKMMQEKFDTDADLKPYGLKARSAQFVKEDGTNKFKGVVKVESKDGMHDVSDTATTDGKNIILDIDPQGFSFLMMGKLNQSIKQLQDLFKGLGTN